MSFHKGFLVVSLCVMTAACGTTPTERAVSGGAIGAGAGALGAAALGGSPWAGAAIGGGVGAVTGAVTH